MLHFSRPRIVARGAEELKGKDSFLDNDDLRPLKLKDRTWTATTYFVFWFSATATVSNWYEELPVLFFTAKFSRRQGMAPLLLRRLVFQCGSLWPAHLGVNV